MRNVSLALACLVCAGLARRLHTSTAKIQNGKPARSEEQTQTIRQVVDAARSLTHAPLREISVPLRSFATFLLAVEPAVAFNCFGDSGVRRRIFNPAHAYSRLVPLDRRFRLQHDSIKMSATDSGLVFDGMESFIIESAQAPGKYLSVENDNTELGSKVHLWDDRATASARWVISATEDLGRFTIQNQAAEGKFINVDRNEAHNGAKIHLWDNPESAATQWILHSSGYANVYTIENANARGKYLTSSGTGILLWDQPMQWRLVRDKSGGITRKFDVNAFEEAKKQRRKMGRMFLNEAWRQRFGTEAPATQREEFALQMERAAQDFMRDYLAKRSNR